MKKATAASEKKRSEFERSRLVAYFIEYEGLLSSDKRGNKMSDMGSQSISYEKGDSRQREEAKRIRAE